MVRLKNEFLEVTVYKKGAELRSVIYGGTEQMWKGDPDIWNGVAPLLFPICGGLKEDKYILNGKEYTLQKHGYVQDTEFSVESKTDTEVTFLHISNEETKKCFPFDYELRVIYRLKGKKIETEYRVDNKSVDTMYFSIGSHEGFWTPEGIEDYDIVFDTEIDLDASMLYGNIVANDTHPMLRGSRVLPLYDKDFIIDALVFRNCPARAATLRNRKNGRKIRMEFPDAPTFFLWHKHLAPYICLEPWLGLPDVEGSSFDITEKEGIISLESGKTFENIHTIIFG